MKKIIKYLIIEKIANKDQYYLRMTPEMQDDIGTVGHIQFRNTDKISLKENDEFMALEASKAILTLKMPFDAKVVEWNKEALINPSLVSSHKDSENWIMIISDINPEVLANLEDF
ncbi:glycine cleavage system protein H [Mycoplasma tauri]|uniref:Glycine cleavage system protein H n=1 Tax=Mycoplasma tauri TaxID=547987 RepID=A0A953NEG3_9MOLU|nr:glycine cleavage system protein H [Mycoplasma tauri]MBZ4195487.1 glycine cleavage system protein H [Mycoplasma tauri]MBZ4203632.1 glycine cleavage system protein H [Mycoplasma tauri]MBZ4212562.1 glycine cleavage system protein H [Mycoplasma tauri]MBZ4226705.1 glycine cleavage system protein H [Mycoplasma tauri]QSB07297.1 glycine cleavage system protein H [Mycoplasma tauri]